MDFGYSKLVQEMSDKMQNESGQFNYTINIKNVVKMGHFYGFSDILDVSLDGTKILI